jgi:hypothetical protein
MVLYYRLYNRQKLTSEKLLYYFLKLSYAIWIYRLTFCTF